MINILKLIGLAALPAIIILIWVYQLDKKRPEPIGMIGQSILYGFIAIIPVIFIEKILERFNPGGIAGAFYSAFLVAALVEEGGKFLFIRAFIYNTKKFNEVIDGIVYTICVSLGFAFAENLLYGISNASNLYLRAFTAVPLHALASGIMGFYLGRAKKLKGKQARKLELKGLVWAVLIHGFYDVFIFVHPLGWPLSMIVLVSGFFILKKDYKIAKKLDDNFYENLESKNETNNYSEIN